jgi:hypothetical protein
MIEVTTAQAHDDRESKRLYLIPIVKRKSSVEYITHSLKTTGAVEVCEKVYRSLKAPLAV